jgi:hypothetical protein
MPIRFRCQHCRQLLGIARRKAGTQVECPTCLRSLTVPTQDDPDLAPDGGVDRPPESPPVAAPPGKRDLFERSDFDIEMPKAVPRPAALPAPASAPLAPAPSAEPGKLSASNAPAPSSGPPGIVLTPTQATVLTVTAILLLAVAFGAGLLVGRFLI